MQREARRAAVRTSKKALGRRKVSNLDERRQWTASCRLDQEEMLDFIQLCEDLGTTRYAAIKAMIREYVRANKDRRGGTGDR